MTLQTSHYHYLTCNARVDNIVSPVCTTQSPGKWHDAELMEKEAEQLGWAKTPRGHTCPACSAAAAALDKPVATPRQGRKPKQVAPESFDGSGSNDWEGGQ